MINAPNKLYISRLIYETWQYHVPDPDDNTQVEYIRKDALLDYLQKELERLWELIPDASNEAPTQMEMRYLGEYMATERLIDEIKLL